MVRYFIYAKKCDDTMLFLVEYAESVLMTDIREKVADAKRKFYINACVVLDKSFPKDKMSKHIVDKGARRLLLQTMSSIQEL